VTAAGVFHLDRPAADEFLEVYQGILADIEYNATTMELTSGRLLALELTSNSNGNSKSDDSDVVNAFRNLCGPYPVHIAKKIRSDCLRAQFGRTVAENAVHCTDLKSDGIIECEYFFGILGSSY
jgi:nucleoside-diphosphate kinase